MAFARYERPITDAAGNIVLSAYVEVRREVPGFPLAVPLYADFDGETTMDNPFHVTDGLATFHAVGGWYRLRVYAPGYERVYRHVPLGTAQAADIDAYAQAGFTWAPESGTSAPPATGAMRFDDEDIALAGHVYVSRQTLGGSEVTGWLLGLSAEDYVLLSTGVGVEVGWPVLAVTSVDGEGDDPGYVDIEVDTAEYQGPAGPLSFGDSGFVTISRERTGDATAAAAAAAASALEASNSETTAGLAAAAAGVSETNAAASEDAASLSAASASASALAASSSSISAALSKSSAEAAATAAAELFDLFGDLWLGAHDTPPATDNDGSPLEEGDLYWNSTTKQWGAWDSTGGQWVYLSSGGSAGLITFTPAGGVTATNVQAALEELGSLKAAAARTISAGTGLTGGGDLGADRALALADMAESTIKGRAAGAGTGAPQDLTASQIVAILGNDLRWASKAIGEIIFLPDNLVGVDVPPTDAAYRYIKLTAGLTGTGGYNDGCLTGESVIGSAPLVLATAEISLSGSPMNGQTVHLLNTEGRILRPSTSPGVAQNDQMQQITGDITVDVAASVNTQFLTDTDNNVSYNGAFSMGGTRSQNTIGNSNAGSGPSGILFNSADSPSARTGTETRMKNVGVTAYMRIK